jgi:hypothetical protein
VEDNSVMRVQPHEQINAVLQEWVRSPGTRSFLMSVGCYKKKKAWPLPCRLCFFPHVPLCMHLVHFLLFLYGVAAGGSSEIQCRAV